MDGNTDEPGLLLGLLKILENEKTREEEKVDVYLKISSHISKDLQCFINEVSKSVDQLLIHIKVSLTEDDTSIVQAALQVLGYMLHCKSIVRSCNDVTLTDVLQDLFALLKDSNDKGVCTRILWCLSRQNISNEVLSKKLSSLLNLLEACIVSKNFESSSFEFEALNVIKRILNQFPKEMSSNKDDWFRIVYPFVISNTPKVAEAALQLMEENIKMLKANNANFSPSLINDLNKGLIEGLHELFSKKKELYVLRVWSCLITILGKVMHQGSPLTNSLFKVVEQAFKTNSTEVLIAAYNAWSKLIDNFATSKAAICSKKRLKLLLMPLVNSVAKSQRDQKVEEARLAVWWHLLCHLRNDLNEVFEQVVAPLLLFLFSTNEEQSDESVVDLPMKDVNNLENASLRTPASERYCRAIKNKLDVPSLHFESVQLKVKGAEILYCLMKPEGSEMIATEINKDNLNFKRLSANSFKNSSVFFFIALQDLTMHCSEQISGNLFYAIWNAFCLYVNEIAGEGDKKSAIISIGGLLQSLNKFVEMNCISIRLAMKILSNCYDVLKGNLAAHRDLMKKDDNPHGHFAMHILKLVLSNNAFVTVDSTVPHKFKHLVLILITDLMKGTGQLTSCQQVMKRLGDAPCGRDNWLRFWEALLELLLKYINRNHDINQGDNLQHDFSALLDILLFPIKKFFQTELTLAFSNTIVTKWERLFLAFVREAALVPTTDDNQALDELCAKIDALFRTEQLDFGNHFGALRLIERLIGILNIVTRQLEYTKTNSKSKTGQKIKTTPVKRSKGTPPLNKLGNAKSLTAVVLRILHCLSQLQRGNLEAKAIDQHVGAIFEVIQVFFSKIVGDGLIKESLKRFSHPVVILASERLHRQNSSIFELSKAKRHTSGKPITRLLDGIFNCITERYYGKMDDELLVCIAPLLRMTLCSEKDFIRSRAINFWNKTFGLNKDLQYPDELSERFLLNIKSNVSLTLPGLKSDNFSDNVVLSSQSSSSPKIKMAASILKSPHRVRGSFLQKVFSAEKAANSPPANIIIVSSPKTESKVTTARRKLPYEENTNDDFIKIVPSPKKRRILTEHQKEVMRSRSQLPVLYNELDQVTQDGIISDDTQLTLDSFPSKASLNTEKSKQIENADYFADTNAQSESSVLSGSGQTQFSQTEVKQEHATKRSLKYGQCTLEDNLAKESCKQDGLLVSKSTEIASENSSSSRKTDEKKKQSKTSSKYDMNSAQKQSNVKPNARRSVALSFKQLFGSIVSSDSDEVQNKESNNSSEKDLPDVIASSFTSTNLSAAKDQPLPFAFSTASYFGGNRSANACDAGTSSGPESQETSSCDVLSATSPDFIPSSQSQREHSPVLKGLSLVMPHRLPRKTRNTNSARSDDTDKLETAISNENVIDVVDLVQSDVNVGQSEVPLRGRKSAAGNNVVDDFKAVAEEDTETQNTECEENVLKEVIDGDHQAVKQQMAIDLTASDRDQNELQVNVVVDKIDIDKHDGVGKMTSTKLDEHCANSQDKSGSGLDGAISKDPHLSISSESGEVLSKNGNHYGGEMSGDGTPVPKKQQNETSDDLGENRSGENSPVANSEKSNKMPRALRTPVSKRRSARKSKKKIKSPRILVKRTFDEKMLSAGASIKTKKTSKMANPQKRGSSKNDIYNTVESAVGSNGTDCTEIVSETQLDSEMTPELEPRKKPQEVTQEVDRSSDELIYQTSDESQSIINTKLPVADSTKKSIGADAEHDIDKANSLLKGATEESPSACSNAPHGYDANTVAARVFFSPPTSSVPTGSLSKEGADAVNVSGIGAFDTSFNDDVSLADIKRQIQVIVDSEPGSSEPKMDPLNLQPVSNPKAGKGDVEMVQSKTKVQPLPSKPGSSRKRKFENESRDSSSRTVEIILTSSSEPTGSLSSLNDSFQILESKSSPNIEIQILDDDDDDDDDNGDARSNKNFDDGKDIVEILAVDNTKKKQDGALFEMPRRKVGRPKRKQRAVNSKLLGKKPLTSNNDVAGVTEDRDGVVVSVSNLNSAGNKANNDGNSGQANNDDHALYDKQCTAVQFAHSRDDCSSPLQRRRNVVMTSSPAVSPVSGILKKKLNGKIESPSPPNKNRRVSFAYPLEEKRSIKDQNAQNKNNTPLAQLLPSPDVGDANRKLTNGTPKRGFTAIKNKYTSPKVTTTISGGTPICVELIECSTPIEKLLPSLTSATWSRGLGNIVRAQNIRTVGNLCALSERQIESLPIRSPKIDNVKLALQKFQTEKNKLDQKEKSRVATNDLPLSTVTPTKSTAQLKETNLETPSRRSLPKPTSLFSNAVENGSTNPSEKGCSTSMEIAESNANAAGICSESSTVLREQPLAKNVDDNTADIANADTEQYFIGIVDACTVTNPELCRDSASVATVTSKGEKETAAKADITSESSHLDLFLSELDGMLSVEQLSKLNLADSFSIHDKLTMLGKRVMDSMRAKMTKEAN